jgi:hypothetical protein
MYCLLHEDKGFHSGFISGLNEFAIGLFGVDAVLRFVQSVCVSLAFQDNFHAFGIVFLVPFHALNFPLAAGKGNQQGNTGQSGQQVFFHEQFLS